MTGFISVRDRQMSLWQSATHEATAGLAETKPGQAAAIRNAANRSVEDRAAGQPLTPAVAARSGPDLAHLSELFFELGKAQVAGDAAKVATLTQAVEAAKRDYSSDDIKWLTECLKQFNKYYAQGVDPIYRDWKSQPGRNKNFGVITYTFPANAKVMLIADWGTDLTDNVEMLRQGIKHLSPDVIIHLGDVYYSGTEAECTRNVLNVMDDIFKDGTARIPIFAIPGNHEYYSGGGGFYKMIDQLNAGIPAARQKASYFCLRSADGLWQFLGMDTGFDDHDPTSVISLLKRGPELNASEAEWHQDKIENFLGTTILLSHHQLISANDPINGPLGIPQFRNNHLFETFQPYFNRIGAWYWGHEHDFAAFAEYVGLKKPRLIGCGAYEESESGRVGHTFGTDVPYIPDMPSLGLSDYLTGGKRYYNHAFAMLKFSPGRATKASYYQYPSWDRSFAGARPDLFDPSLKNPFFTETIPPVRQAGT